MNNNKKLWSRSFFLNWIMLLISARPRLILFLLLLLGIAVGQLLHFHPEQTMTSLEASLEPPIVASETAREQRPQTRISSTDSVIESDDTFLDDLEVILSRPQVPELSPFDEITPQIRAVSVNVW